MHFGRQAPQYAVHLQNTFGCFVGKRFYLRDEGPTYTLRICSKSIYYYFHKHLAFDATTKHSAVQLISLAITRELKIGFLRGLVDTGSSVTFCADRN